MEKQFDTQIVTVDEELKLSMSTDLYENYVTDLKEANLFQGKAGEVYFVRLAGHGMLKNVIFVGIGGLQEQSDLMKIQSVFGKAVKKAAEVKAKAVLALLDEGLSIEATAKAIETMHLARYTFDKYHTDERQKAEEIDVSVSSPHDMKGEAKEAHILAEQTCLARNLVNEPARVLTPTSLAQAAVEQGKKYGFDVQVYGKAEIEALKMEAFLAVGQGSSQEPKLIVMRYQGGGTEKVALVGKGITYDSGGYCLKPPAGMEDMKSDMGGAAAVIGAIGAIARSGLRKNVVGVVAACENMISGGAYHTGDVIGSMSGKFIEVANTDAEGRITLADAVTFAIQKEKADKVVDIATLTGACLVALGSNITGVLSNDEKMWEAISSGAKKATEKVWRLPCDEELAKQNESFIADIKNTGGREGGTITAGMFIREFVQDKAWAHLDIAGPAYTDKDRDNCPKGGTGMGVRTLYHFVKHLEE